MFVGIRVLFKVKMHIPGRKDPLELEFAVEPPDRFQIRHKSSSAALSGLSFVGGAKTTQVYDAMALRAFDHLSTQLHETFFGSQTR